jgi:hypothetical protein
MATKSNVFIMVLGDYTAEQRLKRFETLIEIESKRLAPFDLQRVHARVTLLLDDGSRVLAAGE